MDAVLLALVSAALFGAMPVAVRFALLQPIVPAAVAALFMQVATFAVLCIAAAIQGGVTLHGLAPFLVAGAIAPGLSNLFITVAIREAGSSRASVAFGVAPLFAVTLAVLVFGERPGLPRSGALLIVGGGIALALEPERPAHVRRIGIVLALVGAALFALRDNLVREPLAGHGGTLDDGRRRDARRGHGRDVRLRGRRGEPRRLACARGRALATAGRFRRPLIRRALRGVLPGTVSVVAPIVATEALFGVAFSAILLHRTERVGPRLVLGAALVVAGGALIAAFR